MSEWPLVRLDELCELRPQKAEARARLKPTDHVSFVPMSDLPTDAMWLEPNEVQQLSDVQGSYTYFSDGDVLLAKITPCFENGKLGIARNLVNGIGFGSSEFFVLRPSEKLLPEYLYYFLVRQDFRDDGAAVMTGAVGHRRVPKEFIEGTLLPLPSLAEQRHLVGILDAAFEGIAKAIANAERNIAKARELFDAVRKTLFAGTQIEFVALGQACENLDSRRIPITKKDRMPGSTPYYGASGIVDHVAEWIFDEDILLVSEDGANLLMRTYPIAFSVSGKCWVNNHAHVLRFSSRPQQALVEHYLNSISLEPWVSGMAQPKLNQKALNSIPIPVCSDELAADLVGKLDELSVETERARAAYERRLQLCTELRESLLHKTFSGQLAGKKAIAA